MHGGVDCVAGVVDDDVEAPEGVDGGLDDARTEAVRGDVTWERDCPPAGRLDSGYGVVGFCRVQVRHDDGGAVLGEQDGDRPADALRRPRHNGHLTVQQRFKSPGTGRTVNLTKQSARKGIGIADTGLVWGRRRAHLGRRHRLQLRAAIVRQVVCAPHHPHAKT